MNFPAINAHLSERRVAMLSGAVEKLEAGIAAGSIRNVDFNDAKDTVNRAIEEAAEAFLKSCPTRGHHMGDWWKSAYDANAFVSGASNVAPALKRAQKAGDLKEYADFVAALLPLTELLQSAKPLIVKRQDQPKVVSPKEAAKLAKSMTCQCCARPIFAETGLIAHHGYQRPGGGWQTASCMGARRLPFEVSRDALGSLIASLKDWAARAVAVLAEVKAERAPVVVTVSDYSAPRGRDGSRPTLDVKVTRANFDEVLKAHRKSIASSVNSFDEVKSRDLAHRKQEIKGVREEIAAQQARFDGWKKTHDWNDAAQTWKAV